MRLRTLADWNAQAEQLATFTIDAVTYEGRVERVDVAHRDPYRFLHRTRFGVAGTEMPVGFSLGWTPADGRDVLAYAQSLPEAQTSAEVTGAGEGSAPAPQDLGGPSSNWAAGIFTGILAALGTIGTAVLFLFFIVMIGVAVVFVLRRSK
jgi:hypothetical protein